MYQHSEYYLDFVNDLYDNPIDSSREFCSIHDVKLHKANENETKIVEANKKNEINDFPLIFLMIGIMIVLLLLGAWKEVVGWIPVTLIIIPTVMVLVDAFKSFKTKAYSKISYGVIYDTKRVRKRSQKTNLYAYRATVYFPDIQKYVKDVSISSRQYNILKPGDYIAAYVSRGMLNITTLNQ